MARILVTGNITRDVINLVDHYPAEDEEMRASAQEIRPGGNAANTAAVLAQQGHETDFLGTIARDTAGESLLEAMRSRHINTQHCPRLPGVTPASYITLNQLNGSRTIVHYRDLPELSSSQFPVDAVTNYDWLHFEGRNVPEIRKMLALVHAGKTKPGISLEVEKPRDDIASLYAFADILLFSRTYACSQQFDVPEVFLQSMRAQVDNNTLICGWGDSGAVGMDRAGRIFTQAAWVPSSIVDTVGAGDTFNAGVIHAFIDGKTLPEALSDACELAGRKVGQQGLDNLYRQTPRGNILPT